MKLFPWADKEVDEPWYREITVGEFASEHGHWSIEDQSYEFNTDFDDWFKERFGATIAPYATTSDGRTALWRLELKLNAEGQEMLNHDQQEMLDEAENGAEIAASATVPAAVATTRSSSSRTTAEGLKTWSSSTAAMRKTRSRC